MITAFALFMSLMLGWASANYALSILAVGTLITGGFVITRVRDLWLFLFTIGIHFDDLFIDVGFSKVGYGDFALIVLVAYWILWRYSDSGPIQLPSKWSFVILYVIGVGLSWQQGPTPRAVTGLFIRNSLYVLGYFALVDLLRATRQVKTFIWITFAVTLIHVVIGLFFLERLTRLEGLSGQPNIFGGLIGPGALIAIIASASPFIRLPSRVALGLSGLFIAVGLLLTVSRGAQIAFISAILWTYRKRWRGILTAGVLIGVILQVILILDPTRLDYFFTRWQFDEGSIGGRRDILFNAINIIFEKPFFGIGFAQFMQLDTVMSLDAGHGRASHNHYLGEFATIGLPTALILFSFIIHQGRQLWRLSHLADQRSQLYVKILQALFIFQSVTLIFRGGRRMIEWAFLAVYTATAIIYHQQPQSSEHRDDEQVIDDEIAESVPLK